MQVSESDELGIMFIISFYHCLLQSGIKCWFYNEQCKLFIVRFHTNLLNHEFLFQMPLFLFLVEVPVGGAWRFRIELQWEQARPWMVTSMISSQLLSWFMIYKCFFCFSFVGGCGLLWISSHRRRWTCVSGAPLKPRTSKSGATGSRPWVEIFAVFVISQNLEMLFLFCCVGGVSGTPPPLLDLLSQLQSILELHRSRD